MVTVLLVLLLVTVDGTVLTDRWVGGMEERGSSGGAGWI